MTVTGYIRGNLVEWIEDEDGIGGWLYPDGVLANRELSYGGVVENRPCPLCGAVGNGADPCIGYLPGVEQACCGHGIEPCYVVWSHGVRTIGEVLRS